MRVNETYVTKNEGQSMKAYVTKEKGPKKRCTLTAAPPTH